MKQYRSKINDTGPNGCTGANGCDIIILSQKSLTVWLPLKQWTFAIRFIIALRYSMLPKPTILQYQTNRWKLRNNGRNNKRLFRHGAEGCMLHHYPTELPQQSFTSTRISERNTNELQVSCKVIVVLIFKCKTSMQFTSVMQVITTFPILPSTLMVFIDFNSIFLVYNPHLC